MIIESLTVLNAVYVAAIALQLSGAILLIIKYWIHPVSTQIKNLDSKRTHIDGETLVLGDSIPSNHEFAEEIWLSRIALIYITVGYVLGIFGESFKKSVVVLLIIVGSIMLVLAGKWLSKKLIKKY